MNKFLQEWFDELGYDATKYYMDTTTAEIVEKGKVEEENKKNVLKPNSEVPVTEVGEI